MAWNEPGNSGDKDKDPWSKQRGDDGPPDLEDIVKNLQDKVTSIFGGGRRGGGSGRGSSGNGMSPTAFALIFIAVIGVWFVSGIYIVTDGTRGVVLQFGKFNKTTDPGPQWFPRFIQSVDIVETDKSRSVRVGVNKDEALMLTSDENIVDVRFEVQYKVKNAEDFLFQVATPEVTIKTATESALREIVGKKKMKSVLERDDVAQKTGELLQEILDRYRTGLLVENVNLDYSDAPEEVKPAFNDVNSAEQDRDRFIEEARKYENQVVPIARGQAARITQEAEAYRAEKIARASGDASRFTQLLVEYKKAPKVTRERLYLEAMEEVLGNNNKVMIDVKKGNSLLYLPIDQLNKNRRIDLNENNTESDSQNSGAASSNLSSRDRSRHKSRSREVRR
ncbi:HflK protein [hydrothermal vent metagenome]|uniref:HflK protein n=1 Tax=hydrothermal vent metagenome TaxID=652676 RepID=A0A3B0ZHF9_9ZZZZ